MDHSALSGSYDLPLVALSFVLAVFASYTALNLAARVDAASGRARAAWLVGGAAAMGLGIWSMHFTGMLAFVMPVPVQYDVPLVLLSLAAVIASSGASLALVSGVLSWRTILASGPLVGGGIAAMHYIGMAAMKMPARISYDPLLLAASVAIAVGASMAALWLFCHFRRRTHLAPQLGSSLIMGVAITGMHYTGMSAARFTSHPAPAIAGLTHADSTVLGFGIGIATLVLLGGALLCTLIDRRFALQADMLAGAEQRHRSLFDQNPDVVLALDAAGVCREANSAAARVLGYAPEELLGRPLAAVVRAGSAAALEEHWARGAGGEARSGEIVAAHRDGHDVELLFTSVPIVVGGAVVGIYGIARDITARKRAEQALRASEASLRASAEEQQVLLETVRKLSTPVLPVRDNILVVPLVGHIDAQRSEHMLEEVLRAVERSRALRVILDVTGVPLIDTAVAGRLIDLAAAARLLGARCALVGISPEVAQTLVQLGADLGELTTHRDLQAGIAHALELGA